MIYSFFSISDHADNPVIQETKIYFLFLAIFLILQSYDWYQDVIMDLEDPLKSFPRLLPILSVLLVIFYIVFIAVGFEMANDRRITYDWEHRQTQYVEYEIFLYNNGTS